MEKRTRIPGDFKVSDRIMELARENGWPDPRREVDAFKDHHLAKGTLMLDWEAAFRTWLRNCLRFAQGRPVSAILVKPKPKTKEPPELQLSDEQRRENLRRFGKLLHETIKKLDVRKEHEKL